MANHEKNELPDGTIVTVAYTGKTLSGYVFDTTKGREPLTFTIGKKRVMPAFESAVKTMAVGETRRIVVPAKHAFGERNPKLIQSVPRKSVEGKARIFLGNKIALQIPYTTHVAEATIIYYDQNIVTLDLNPSMAGQDVEFEITLLRIQEQEEKGHSEQ
ncbi:MAG: FKBP-type peptidyl-prolyl cis-trans isomerase [Candidatus Woesearchaeota archaeon]